VLKEKQPGFTQSPPFLVTDGNMESMIIRDGLGETKDGERDETTSNSNIHVMEMWPVRSIPIHP
jgi:hypothetical protein